MLTLLLLACTSSTHDPIFNPAEDDPGFSLGQIQTCESPTAGFNRLTPSAADRGVLGPIETDTQMRACYWFPGNLAAHDLDGDGDVDLSFNQLDGFPSIQLNDGSGQFTAVAGLPAWTDQHEIYTHGWADLDGDGLPELLAVGLGFLATAHNEGSGSFAPLELQWEQEAYPKDCIGTFAVGDADGDGNLDVFLPAMDRLPTADFFPIDFMDFTTSPDPLLLGDGQGGLTHAEDLLSDREPGLSIFAAFSDRDNDGDLDLLVGTSPRIDQTLAFLRNEGTTAEGPTWVDDAAEIGAGLRVTSMGIAQWDVNSDGVLDQCMSDIRDSLTCLISDGAGGYVESAVALGLFHDWASDTDAPNPGEDGHQRIWITWSVEATDLDNDGHEDMVTVAGAAADGGNVTQTEFSTYQPDAIWQGTADGFVERTADLGFGDGSWRYGMATADLDGDGHLEIITHGYGVAPEIWDNPCGEGSWIQLDFRGPDGNRPGLGVVALVTAGGTTHMQQLHGLRSMGQGPSTLHFGLGTATTVDKIEVRWPGGDAQVIHNVGPNRRVTVSHPSQLATTDD